MSVLWVRRWKYVRCYHARGNTSLCSGGGCIEITGLKEGVGVIGLCRIENCGVEMGESSDDVIDW
eukprot:14871480-Ditylum_brightwellii.AAC.1